MANLNPNDFTMFPKSQPWGYEPLSVEKRISQYENAIGEVNKRFLEEQQINAQLNQRIEKLQDELKNMHIQLSSLELPDVEEAIEHMVLNDFQNYNSNNKNNYNEKKQYKNEEKEDNNEDNNFVIAGDGSEEKIHDNNGNNNFPFIIAE